MLLAERIRAIREGKSLSQWDVEKRSGMMRVYLSRIENGHTIPSIETLEKLARALGVPFYQLFYDGRKRPKPLKLPAAKGEKLSVATRASSGKAAPFLFQLSKFLAHMKEPDRKLLLLVAHRMASKRKTRFKNPSRESSAIH